jgi:hypothetical protein
MTSFFQVISRAQQQHCSGRCCTRVVGSPAAALVHMTMPHAAMLVLQALTCIIIFSFKAVILVLQLSMML